MEIPNIPNITTRISPATALEMWRDCSVAELGALAQKIKTQKSGSKVYYNRNIHIEPTNVCSMGCTFCSFAKSNINEQGAWSYSLDEIEGICQKHSDKGLTEVHIVGGVDPERDFDYYLELLRIARRHFPTATLKAYTAVELHHIIRQQGLSVEEGLRALIDAGMGTIAGGGAEIFAPRVRNIICPQKCDAKEWLKVHETAHRLGVTSNATILYGHIETMEERIDHLCQLRTLQDKTGGFNAFIPLEFKTAGNQLGENTTPISTPEKLKFMALCRIFLDNFAHLKAYWPMLGKETTEMALAFGADDIDGTIDDTTKIYSMAGAEEQTPRMGVEECREMAARAGYVAVERDSLYNEIE